MEGGSLTETHDQQDLNFGWTSATALLMEAFAWQTDVAAIKAAEQERLLLPFKEIEATPWPLSTWRMIRGDNGADNLTHIAKTLAAVIAGALTAACFSGPKFRFIALTVAAGSLAFLALLAWIATGLHSMARHQCEPSIVKMIFEYTGDQFDDARVIHEFVSKESLALPDDLFRLEELRALLSRHEAGFVDLQEISGLSLEETRGISPLMDWRKTRLYVQITDAQRRLAAAYGDITARFQYLDEELSAAAPEEGDLDAESLAERIRRLLPELNQASAIAALAKAIHEKKSFARMLSSDEWQSLRLSLNYEEQKAHSTRTA